MESWKGKKRYSIQNVQLLNFFVLITFKLLKGIECIKFNGKIRIEKVPVAYFEKTKF